MGSEIDWKTIATRGAGPKAQCPRSKTESILLSAFLYPPFWFSLLLCFSLLTPEQREGHLPRGRIIHCPWSQWKQSAAQRQRSLPFSTVPAALKGTFQSKMPPLTSSCPTPCGQGQARPGHRGIPQVGGAIFLPQ